MSKTTNTTIQNLSLSADYFDQLHRDSKEIRNLYRKAAKLTDKASRATKKAMEASHKASLRAAEVLGIDSTKSSADNIAANVPCIMTTDEERHAQFAKFFAELTTLRPFLTVL